ncbi:hypothetical protein HJG60_008663 [Phyllostomus discolor]|uniref:Uncharacterized protein n=1 Tax=Phyllostomus discolor TaxID=89673 RepID=A0A834DLB8_9CHIR|nr:hypothetical protein HJG60_008663 [Phyllostomus discolor]
MSPVPGSHTSFHDTGRPGDHGRHPELSTQQPTSFLTKRTPVAFEETTSPSKNYIDPHLLQPVGSIKHEQKSVHGVQETLVRAGLSFLLSSCPDHEGDSWGCSSHTAGATLQSHVLRVAKHKDSRTWDSENTVGPHISLDLPTHCV